MAQTLAGKLAILVNPRGKRYLKRILEEGEIHTHDGVIPMEDVARAGYGKAVTTHKGKVYRIVRPTLHDLVKGVKRQTQIIYPKEIGYICMRLGIGPGVRVIESGSGSGSLTVALSWFCGEHGRVYTYERREEFSKLCRRNLEWAGVGENVETFVHDIAEGFWQTDVDALFLDVRTPWEYLDQAAAALAPGAPIGFLLPTVNQVSDLLAGLEAAEFEEPEVLEILIRRWKPNAERLRPDDRMVAHTGFLVFSRRSSAAGEAAEALTVVGSEEQPLPEPLAGIAAAYGEDTDLTPAERIAEPEALEAASDVEDTPDTPDTETEGGTDEHATLPEDLAGTARAYGEHVPRESEEQAGENPADQGAAGDERTGDGESSKEE